VFDPIFTPKKQKNLPAHNFNDVGIDVFLLCATIVLQEIASLSSGILWVWGLFYKHSSLYQKNRANIISLQRRSAKALLFLCTTILLILKPAVNQQ
jgi:hypothetical protein